MKTGSLTSVFVLQAAVGADAALDNARNTRAAVGKTLRDVGILLANISKSFSLLPPLYRMGSETPRFLQALNGTLRPVGQEAPETNCWQFPVHRSAVPTDSQLRW